MSACVERSTDDATVDASSGSGAESAAMAADVPLASGVSAAAGAAAAASVEKMGLLMGDAAAPTERLRAGSTGDAAGGRRDRSECNPDGI